MSILCWRLRTTICGSRACAVSTCTGSYHYLVLASVRLVCLCVYVRAWFSHCVCWIRHAINSQIIAGIGAWCVLFTLYVDMALFFYLAISNNV